MNSFPEMYITINASVLASSQAGKTRRLVKAHFIEHTVDSASHEGHQQQSELHS